MTDLKLYQFYWNCGRMGDIEGLFAATKEEIAGLLGKEIYFGEVLGKHSEIFGTFDLVDIKVLDISPEAVTQIVAATGTTISGFNPFDYYESNEEE